MEKRRTFEGVKDSLKTRLVHYFVRCCAIQSSAEEDNDLEDLDKLVSTIRQLYSTHFTIFTPIDSIRKEVMLQISNSLTQLNLSKQGMSKVPSVSRETQTDDTDIGNLDSEADKRDSRSNLSRRQLLSNLEPVESTSLAAPFGRVQPSGSGLARKHSTEPERMLRRFRLSGAHDDFEQDSDSSLSCSPPRGSKSRPRRSNARRSRPVSEWNLRYDGRDGGRDLMKFIREVEFYAKSEDVSDKELFRSAIHLFSGLAKLWFMSGVENEDFTTWKDLVTEMKKEFLSPDHDHVSEVRAIDRKQRSKEKFQDFFFDIQKIFNSLTKPISEKKKFEIVFRNLRADYKGHVVAAQIDNLADLKAFGRKLDATFWFKYESRSQDDQVNKSRTQVNELKSYQKQKPFSDKSRPVQKDSPKPLEERVTKKTHSEDQPSEKTKSSGSTPDGLKTLVEKYVPLRPGTCFNCRLPGHHQNECDRPKHKFCYKCGFMNVETKSCPWCEKNA